MAAADVPAGGAGSGGVDRELKAMPAFLASRAELVVEDHHRTVVLDTTQVDLSLDEEPRRIPDRKRERRLPEQARPLQLEREPREGVRQHVVHLTRDARRFLLDHTPAVSPKRAKLIVSALRSFLRFRYQRGVLATDLALALPAVADWRLSSVPKFIAPDEVERLLAA